MNTDRYNIIKESLPSSILMAMEHIRRFLDDGKASVMVGAGFSKNAIKPDFVEMKDWNALGKVFYKLLYSHDPESRDLEFKTPIRLASQVEASFGRNELDKLIAQSLPDDAISPGELHVELLKLNWHDVFTTNYDTLLERAYLDAGVSYNVVTNKDTLLYTKSPRIIKLHGSFPDIHPFIITEEDFRTYPDKFPGFVNTVRQAMIESVFCLIGFSGDDPNFLNWLGWLRDVMEDSISPVYLITFDNNIHESEQSLMQDRGIKILNLANASELTNIQEALSFFFEFMRKEGTSEWNGSVAEIPVKSVQDVKLLTERMKDIRLSYPGWIFLPDNHFDDFNDLRSGAPAFWKFDKIKDLSIHDKIALMYETNWRLQVSMHPFKMPWLTADTSGLDWENDSYEDGDNSKVIDLKISLLRDYHEDGEYDKFEGLHAMLEDRLSQMSPEQRRLFTYECCLYYLSRLNQDKVDILLQSWNTSPSDYIGVIWKARVLIESGKTVEANNLLTSSLQNVQSLLLGSGANSYRLRSAKTAISSLIALIEMRRNEIPAAEKYMDSYNVVKRLKQDFFTDKTKKVIERKHDFRINRATTTWNTSSGYNRQFLNSYRYFRLQEFVGYPIGWANGDINTDDVVLFISSLIKYMPSYAIGLMLRSNNYKVQEACINRQFLRSLTPVEANGLFDELYDKILLTQSKQDRILYSRSVHVIIPLLSKLCTKVSQDRLIKMGQVMIDLYQNSSIDYKPELHGIIINCVDRDHAHELAKSIYELPISDVNIYERDICLMEMSTLKNVAVTDLMISRIQDAINTDNQKLLRFAYIRLCNVVEMERSDQQTEVIINLVHQWRNKTVETVNKYLSLRFAEYDATMDRESPEEMLDACLTQFFDLDMDHINSSEVFNNIERSLTCLSVFSKQMTAGQHADVLTRIAHFMEVHKDRLSKDDSQELLGGFRKYAIDVWDALEEYLKDAKLDNVNPELLALFDSLIKDYGKNGFPFLALRVMLLPYLKTINEKQIIKDITANITNSKKPVLMNDAIFALVLLSKRRVDIQSVIGRVVSYVEFSYDPEIRISLHLLTQLVKDKKLNQKSQQRIYALLNRLAEKIPDCNLDYEYVTDLNYFTLMLAGAMKSQYGAKPATDKWEEIYNDENQFNDVKRGFEMGLSLQ